MGKAFNDKLKAQLKELHQIAHFISDKGLKLKNTICFDRQLDYFRGKLFSFSLISQEITSMRWYLRTKQVSSRCSRRYSPSRPSKLWTIPSVWDSYSFSTK